MHDKYATDGLVIIAVNLDDSKNEPLHSKVRGVLTAEKAPFVNVAGATTKDINAIVDRWEVSLMPRNILYDRTGSRARAIEGPDIEEYARRHPDIAELLRQVLPALQVLGPSPAATGGAGLVCCEDGPPPVRI